MKRLWFILLVLFLCVTTVVITACSDGDGSKEDGGCGGGCDSCSGDDKEDNATNAKNVGT
jgi:hypothetical protein